MIKNKRRCKTIVHTFVQLASLFPVAKNLKKIISRFHPVRTLVLSLNLHSQKCGLFFKLAKKFIQALAIGIQMVLSFCATHFCYFKS